MANHTHQNNQTDRIDKTDQIDYLIQFLATRREMGSVVFPVREIQNVPVVPLHMTQSPRRLLPNVPRLAMIPQL